MTVWTSSQDRKFDDFVVPKLKLPHEQLLDIKNRFAALRKKLTDHLGMTDRPVDGGALNPIADLIAGRLGVKRQTDAGAAGRRPVGVLPREGEPSTSSDFPSSSYSSPGGGPARKKAKISAKLEEEKDDAEEDDDDKDDNDDEDEDDDEEAIRQMKVDSKVLKEMNKYRKGKKKNITTFRQRVQEANEKRQQQRVKKFTTRVPVAEMKSGRETGKRNGHSTTSSPSPNRKPFKNQQNRQPQEKQRPRNKKFTTRVPVAEMNNNKKQATANRGANNNNNKQQQQPKRSFKGGNKKFTTKVRVSETSGGGGKGGFKPKNKNKN